MYWLSVKQVECNSLIKPWGKKGLWLLIGFCYVKWNSLHPHAKRIRHSFNFNGWRITQALSDLKETIIYNWALSGRTNLPLISCVWGCFAVSDSRVSCPKTTAQVSDEVAPRLGSWTPPLSPLYMLGWSQVKAGLTGPKSKLSSYLCLFNEETPLEDSVCLI